MAKHFELDNLNILYTPVSSIAGKINSEDDAIKFYGALKELKESKKKQEYDIYEMSPEKLSSIKDKGKIEELFQMFNSEFLRVSSTLGSITTLREKVVLLLKHVQQNLPNDDEETT